MEEWKDIIWYEWLYQISSMWNVKSLNYNHTWKERLVKASPNIKWYLKVCLCINCIKKYYLVHRLVWLHFISNMDNKKEINHINWIKADNRAENLERVTPSENVLHRFHKLWHKQWNIWKFWKDSFLSKKVNQYTKEWVFIKTWDWARLASRELWTASSSISLCCNWITYKNAWWFTWKYL